MTVTGPPAHQRSPWSEWIDASATYGSPLTHTEWLSQLETQLTAHLADSQYEEARLSALWQHMTPKLAEFLPHEVAHVIDDQRAAAARRGAAEALLLLVQLERQQANGDARPAVGQGVDNVTLSRLLDSFTSDRAATGRAVAAPVLETLCSITLDLELSERRMAGNSGRTHDTLTHLRNHVSAAATLLRALPNNVRVNAEIDEQLAVAVRRCVGRYTGTMDAQLEWTGGDPENPASAAAMVWVLEELLHHLFHSVAGSATVTVVVQPSGTTLAVTAPTNVFAVDGPEPDWLLRSRLRVQLADGEIRAGEAALGTAVEVWFP